MMAEAIVSFVLGKLTDAVVQEYLLLYGVDAQVETMNYELDRIQGFLKDADKRYVTDERQKHWVKEVRNVAYSIEDVIDTFLVEIPQKPQKSNGLMKKMKRMKNKVKKLPAVHKLVNEMTQIQTRLTEIEASRLRYGINNLGEGSGEIQLPIRPLVLSDIDPEIIGFNKDRDHIVKELLNETIKRHYVVSIWGAGGLGKTTLVQKVYNRKIMEQVLDPSIYPCNKLPKDEGVLLAMLYESLKGKNYLIVLDDVWTTNLWTQIGAAFLDENNGSRVLITTRSFDAVKDVDPTCEPYKLGFLTKELSLELLLKKALPNHDPNDSAFHDLSDIMHQFVYKCGGLPLALLIVGGLLLKKPYNYTAWSKVLKTMSWHNDGKKCSEIIGTSYEDLPLALKSCFMYFAAFPEDYEVDGEELIRMWVAEGFIPQEDNRTLEETAESFLEDLVQRSMVHVKSRSNDGSIKCCYIHDLLRDLAVRKAKEDNFLVVYSHPDDQQLMRGARRVAIHHLDCEELVMDQNLRTLLYFGNNKYMPNCAKQRLLKVVSTGTSMFHNKIKLEMFEGLTQLRYLNLIGRPSGKSKKNLEEVISNMKFLQTLWIISNDPNFSRVPDCVWHINTLRHVNGSPLEVPPSTKLTNLHTLPTVIIKEAWETELPHLPNLRCLSFNHRSSSWGAIVTFLGTLEHLIYLHITGSRIPVDIIDMRRFPFYQHLQSLGLRDWCNQQTPNEMAIHVSMFPPHLSSLTIYNYQFHQDIMSALEKLPCLMELVLMKASTNRKINCSAKGFSQLEVLELWDFTLLENWEIEEGVMSILRELSINRCSQLCIPQGLRHLSSLQTLKWRESGRGGKKNDIFNLLKNVVTSNVQINVY